MPKRSAIVVGAGVGGSAVAARLAYAGYDVTVCEKNDFTGGRCSLIKTKDGYRFDRGPSLLLLPKLFEETFRDLGTSMVDAGLDLRKCEPNYTLYFGDGERMALSTSLETMKKEIERFEGVDGFEAYLGFLIEAHRHCELSIDHVLHRNFYSLSSMLRLDFLKSVFVLHPFESIYRRASTYFKTDRLRRAFTFASMYMGMSPMSAPGTYSLLQYTELTEGIWYPIGGFHAVVAAIVKLAEKRGANFRLKTPVQQIKLSPDGRTATGVVLASGQELSADLVCINADLVYAFSNLLPSTPYATSLTKRQSSCSSISFYWSLDRRVPSLGTHSIFLADHYAESFDQIFEDHQMPTEPSFYVNIPSRIDPSAAPTGCDAWVVLVPVGHITAGETAQDYQEMVDRARRLVFQTLEKRMPALKDLQKWIVAEQVIDPEGWRDEFNLDKGAILGLSHSFFNVLSFRPRTRHPTISNCYFVGASAHPGTGVPIVLSGAKMTSEQILQDHKDNIPWSAWSRWAPSTSKVTDLVLDRVHSQPLPTVWIVLTLFAIGNLVLRSFLF